MSLPTADAALDDARPVPTRVQLFLTFFLLGMIGFGGVLPLARQMLVDRRRWLSDEDFVDLLGLCQFLPGGNGINMSVAVGMKFGGPRGAVAALGGLIAIPTAIVVGLGVIYDHYRNDPVVRHLFAGLAAAAAGLLIAMALKVLQPLRRRPVGLALAVSCFVAIALLRTPLVPTMLVAAPLSVLAVRRFER